MNSSFSASFVASGTNECCSQDRAVLTPQVRYYFDTDWRTSFYTGGLLQFQTDSQSKEWFSPYTSEYIEGNRWGLGVIGGYHLKIFKRIGLDFHVGGLTHYGKVRTIVIINGISNDVSNNKLAARPFWGINLCKIPKSNNKEVIEKEIDSILKKQ